MGKVLQEYVLGDMAARYVENEERQVGLLLYPAECPADWTLQKQAALDPLVQVKLTGDIYQGAYAPGHTLRMGESAKKLVLERQELEEDGGQIVIRTILKDSRGYSAQHCLIWKKGAPYVRMKTSYKNESDKKITLELLSSFSLQGITPYASGDAYDRLALHRLRSRWSEEGKLESRSFEDLQLNPSWAHYGVRCERFGSIGSMPVSGYFPFAAIEDRERHVFWGAQLATPSSWQMEIYREDDNVGFSGGIADREFGHWKKDLEPGEELAAPEAIVSAAHTKSLDVFTNRLTAAGKGALEHGPECERELPIIFNEYCTTWGCPSEKNIRAILDVIRDKGFSYFVIDCGWYKEEGVPWDVSMGDYNVSKELFPHGLEQTVAAIRKAGMKAGVWFEIENVGEQSKAYGNTGHLLRRDGQTLTTSRRRFWDMNDAWVQDYLDKKVIGLLKTYGFSYMKVDYNDEIGIGCDGCESLGEGLRRNMLAVYAYFEKARREVPGLVLENCASGGHRLEPGFLARSSMSSFSDAHECEEIPLIAANLHRALLPQQSQIWAVIRKTDSLKRIAYSISNTFLGRMCISGDVTELTEGQWVLITRGMAFYKKLAPVIRDGQSYIYNDSVTYLHHPEGWQAVVRVGESGEAFALFHIFDGALPERIAVPLPEGCPAVIADVYSDTEETAVVEDGRICYAPKENRKAAAFYFRGQ